MSNVNPKRYQDAQDKTNREAVNVAAIVSVMAFDSARMTVDVQPISKHLENGAYQSQPPILGVPVSCMRGGGFIFRPWYKQGDVGWVVYADHDIDRAVSTGVESEPNTERNHSTSDAMFVGGIVTGAAPVTGLPDGAAAISTEDGSVCFAVMPDKVKILANVEIDGSVTASGDVTAGGISLMQHIHGGVENGPSATSRPQ